MKLVTGKYLTPNPINRLKLKRTMTLSPGDYVALLAIATPIIYGVVMNARNHTKKLADQLSIKVDQMRLNDLQHLDAKLDNIYANTKAIADRLDRHLEAHAERRV